MKRTTRQDLRGTCLALSIAVAGGLLTPAPAFLAQATTESVHDPFPRFESIEPNVRFWTNVWGTWSMGQVAVHDVEALDVVYEIVDLPGPIEESYTDEQREFIDDLIDRWSDRLRDIDRNVAAGKPISDTDKALVLNMTDKAGGDILTGAGKRVRTQRGLRERFMRGVEISGRYDAEFRRIFRDAGLPEDLAILPHVESSFQAGARSSAGAVGIWQFTRGAGRRYLTITSSIDERLDPVAAAEGAARYLADAYKRLPDWPIALTSYNYGVAGMRRAVQAHGLDYEKIFSEYRGRTFGFASRNFYAEFLAAADLVRNPELLAGGTLTSEPELDHDSIVLSRPALPVSIAEIYRVPLEELVAINPGWTKRGLQRGLPLPRKTRVWLPATTLAQLRDSGGAEEIPEVAADTFHTIYVVRPGDTLSHIAQAHGMGLGELRQVNGLATNEGLIHAGQHLRVVGDPATHHIVRRGDTLSKIARKYGMTLGRLQALNRMRPKTTLIHVGQMLAVADTADTVHVVERGDTLGRIAASYRVSLRALLALNSLSMQSRIHPGQTIRIPPG